MKKILILFILLLCLVQAAVAGPLQVHFLNVEHGDAMVLLCDGHSMLIDGGEPRFSRLIYSYLNKTLGLKKLDYMVATHPHNDHIGGLSGALNAVEVGKILSPVEMWDSKPFRAFFKYISKQNKKIEVPKLYQKFSLGEAEVEVLGPVNFEEKNPNNLSIVLRVVHGKNSFLFMGDAEKKEESAILKRSGDLKSTVLKVGHHGSKTSTKKNFLKAVNPKFAVISCEKDEDNKHPNPKVLDLLNEFGVKIFRTDLNGHIIVESDGKTLTWQTQK